MYLLSSSIENSRLGFKGKKSIYAQLSALFAHNDSHRYQEGTNNKMPNCGLLQTGESGAAGLAVSLFSTTHPSLNSTQATTGQVCVNFKANRGSLTLTEMRFPGKKSCWRRGLEPGGRALSGISEPFSPGSGTWHGSQRCQMAEARGCGSGPQSPIYGGRGAKRIPQGRGKGSLAFF